MVAFVVDAMLHLAARFIDVRGKLHSWRLLKLTPAAVYYMAGANFAYELDGYERAHFHPPFAWPEGVTKVGSPAACLAPCT